MKVIVACLVLFNASFLCAGEKIELSLEDLKNLNEVTSESYRASISKNPEDMRKKAMRKSCFVSRRSIRFL